MSGLANASLQHTAIGRIVVPPNVPPGFALFYTTIDYHGWLDDGVTRMIRDRFDGTFATCAQVHGTTVQRANREPRTANSEPQCDALWSDEKHTALGIKTADCLPVSIIDPKNSIIANIHSGWRGTVQGITAATLNAAPLDPTAALAYLGPSIRVCCFEVGEEVGRQFDSRFVDRRRGPKPHVDIAALTIELLRERGFAEERIWDSGLCTRCDAGVAKLPGYQVATRQLDNLATRQPLFHSYRRDKRGGRNLAIVAQ